MTAPGPATTPTAAATSGLRHVLVVGGTPKEWAALPESAWIERVETLGRFCGTLGVPWLTIRAYEADPDDETIGGPAWRHHVEGCEVIVDPCGNGRQRFADAMQRLDELDEVNEATVAAALYEPADSEPDLVVVLGPPTQLPPSLVWELAYAELVFIPIAWKDLTVGDVAEAVADFSNRRRRFGGLDDE